LKPDALKKALKSLPKSINETYSRILSTIDEQYQEDTLKVLQWLTYAARPMLLEEVAEALAVDLNGIPSLDPGQRYPDPRDILALCSSLVTLSTSTSDRGKVT
jgi:hypothetical protein